MGATNRSSTLYTNRVTNLYLADARDYGGRVFPVYFEVTVVSASNINDTYDLFVVPANWSVVGLFASTDGLGASAGSGVTAQIGDSGDINRLMVATDFDALDAQGFLAYAGIAYRPTVDTTMELLIGTAAAVVGQIFKGHVLMTAPA